MAEWSFKCQTCQKSHGVWSCNESECNYEPYEIGYTDNTTVIEEK